MTDKHPSLLNDQSKSRINRIISIISKKITNKQTDPVQTELRLTKTSSELRKLFHQQYELEKRQHLKSQSAIQASSKTQ